MGGLVKIGPSRRTKKVRKFDTGRCEYCDHPFEGFPSNHHETRDHRIPKSRGGTNDPSNIARCCFKCNQRKGMMTETEFRNYLETGRRPLGWNGDQRYSLIGGPVAV